MKTANTTATTATVNDWTFTAETITVNGRTFPATYSLAPKGDVYVFVTLKGASAAADLPAVRLHIGASMPMHADAVAAAKAARMSAKTQPAAEATAPAAAPAAPAAPAEPARKKAAKKTQPAAEAAPATAPAAQEPAPAKPAPVEKTWIGTTITGNGWAIAFDADAGRTRVTVEGTPTDAQRAAIEQAGFYWSGSMRSWNKGLTCKAYRAAQNLAATLSALA